MSNNVLRLHTFTHTLPQLNYVTDCEWWRENDKSVW